MLVNEKIGAIVVVFTTILMAMTAFLQTERKSIIVSRIATATFFCWGAWVSPTVIIQNMSFSAIAQILEICQ